MQALINTLVIALFIFAANANAAVLMDEVVSNEVIINAPYKPNGLVNALETTHRHTHTEAALIAPVEGYGLAGNAIAPHVIFQEKVAAKPAENRSLLLLLAVVGLIFFIMRRRSK